MVNDMIRILVDQRNQLAKALSQVELVQKIHPSDANFLLVQMPDANKVYNFLLEKGIVVRDRSKVTLCEGCLRITVGTEAENNKLVSALKNYPNN